MKTKSILVLGCAVLVGVIVFSFTEQTSEKTSPKALPQPPLENIKENKSEKVMELAPVPLPKADSNIKREMLNEYYNLLETIDIQEASRNVQPKEGMIDSSAAQKIALQYARSTSNTNKAPHVILMDDFYIVLLEKIPNPFRVSKKLNIDLKVGIDAWTGEYISGLRSGGGVVLINVNRKTGAGKVGESANADAYYERTFKALRKLMHNVYYGRPWSSEPTPEMISPEEAIQIAASQVAKRKYDKSKEPLPVLVDDLYIVTFWKPNIEELPDGASTFDTRVGIDANSGEYIAMEIAK